MTDANGEALYTEQQKSGGIHAFLGRLTVEATPVPGLGGLTLLGVNQDREAHILHSLFSVPVVLYNPDRQLFGCCGEQSPEGIPAITDIPVASFATWRDISTVFLDDHIFYVEGVLPSSWQKMPYERASDKAEGRNLTYWGLTFLSPDEVVLLINAKGNMA